MTQAGAACSNAGMVPIILGRGRGSGGSHVLGDLPKGTVRAVRPDGRSLLVRRGVNVGL
jgi:hypothetical protein